MLRPHVERFRSFGCEIRRVGQWPGDDPFRDMHSILAPTNTTRIVAFDVGANTGQSIRRLRQRFRHIEIPAFEPGRITSDQLRAVCEGVPGVVLNQFGLDADSGNRVQFECYLPLPLRG